MEKTIECLIRKSIILREQIVSLFSVLLPYGYPIPTINRDQELTRAHRILEKHKIYSRGRFGGWKYEVSNQDHCFIQGKEIIDRLLLGEPETIYINGLSASQG
ncbi:Vacuolar membrane protease [Dirofilaria immitis]